ncbi:MAG: lipid-binding SYLF domain-containing protein [Planctomycetota bacterium]|jgi:lipid-binding SYLF domain-containing protein
MKTAVLYMLAITTVLTFVSGCGPSKKLPIPERRQMIIDMENETLQRLYSENTSTKDEIKNASGYGVFSNANINIIFASAGGGYGVVVDNSTGKRTYMKMGLGGIGLGLGVKDYRQILVFKSDEIMKKFVESGWEFGGHADAAAQSGESGGELSAEGAIGSDIVAYSMTESGLALQATVTGSKYWKDDDLN